MTELERGRTAGQAGIGNYQLDSSDPELEQPNYLPPKPGYLKSELGELTFRDLQARRDRLDNQFARDLLGKLWKQVEDSGLLKDQSFFQNRNPVRLSEVMESNIPRLQDLLKRLRGEHLGVLLLGHEEEVLTRLNALHPLQRMLMPARMPVDNTGRVRLLIDYAENITAPFHRTSHAFRRAGLITLLVCVSLAMILIPVLVGDDFHFSTVFSQFPTWYILSITAFRRNHTGLRALALYISLSDEFACDDHDAEPQAEDSLP
ncbi:hypothetical protein KDL44_13590 [bacterium]|nr:hypothetical protein [bacterium]